MNKRTHQRIHGPGAVPFAMPIRLVHIPNAADADGEPRIALEVPPGPGTLNRRPVLLMFATVSAALAGKRKLEERR